MASVDRLVTSMVFCEAPVDFAYGGVSAGTVAAGARAGGDVASSSKPAGEKAAAAAAESSSEKGARQAECALAFDGLNCFETVVMQPSH